MDNTFTTNNGTQILLRPPIVEDIDELVRYANELSAEDTYLTLSGETLSRADEERYLATITCEISAGNRYQLFAFAGNTLVANADVHRVTRYRKRAHHVGEMAISVSKDWRGQGIGKKLLEILIAEATKLQFYLLILDAFSENTQAIELYEKLGFKKAGEIPEAVLYKGNYIGQVLMYRML